MDLSKLMSQAMPEDKPFVPLPMIGGRSPSEFQSAIYRAAATTQDNLLVEAVAGSGKTTVLLEILRYVQGPAIFLAFAKKNAEDIQPKIKYAGLPGEARTINSLGYRLCRQFLPGARVDGDKLDSLMEKIFSPEYRKRFGWVTKRIVGAAKTSGAGITEPVGFRFWRDVITNGDWDIEDNSIEQVVGCADSLFRASLEELSVVDFDDQIYLPIKLGWRFPQFGTVLVDEAQDLNHLQHLFVERLEAAGARIIAVGDRYQSIFAFRGALSDSLERMKEKFKMTEFPLSICYRCPTSVLDKARDIVPHIQPRDGAGPGLVETQVHKVRRLNADDDLLEEEITDPELFDDGVMVICRNNAPLFACAMRHVRARKPCRVYSNALDGLSTFVKKLAGRGSESNDIEHLELRLEAWRDKEVKAAEAKAMPWKIQQIEDKADTVSSLMEGARQVHDILMVLEMLKSSDSGPIFSTIHKAKGLEADHVYFLRPDLLPAWYVEDPEELQQEMNLRYVAITRARVSLTYGIVAKRRR